ncbi:hypothetical protein KVV02_005276 [Mortierella alpina]|uniref:F-box domain-containing protein n=1 Tax=Mortierella alpina TaxID=64518 RepID=A0A9P8A0F4_MORAP|nr:hypothetical protein KVV02_005276 [Mortierella alpina]
MSANPFDIPEVLRHIQEYLPTSSLATCLRVCRQWHAVILPFVWEDVRYSSSPPMPAAVQKHAHLIRTLQLYEITPQTAPTFFCSDVALSRLKRLEVEAAERSIAEAITTLLQQSSTLVHITVTRINKDLQIPLLNAIADHPTPLLSLNFRGSTLNLLSWQSLWRACTRVENLTLEELLTFEDTSPTTDPRCEFGTLDFSRIKNLALSYLGVPDSSQLSLVARCNQLESLKWDPDLDWILSPTSSPAIQLTDLVPTGCWRHIRRLHWNTDEAEIKDEDLATILNSINVAHDGSSMLDGGAQLQELMLTPQGFGRHSMQALERHFSTLTHFRVGPRFRSSPSPRFVSEATQRILASCPHLVEFHGSLFWSGDLLEGEFARPWACSARLKAITLRVAIDAATEEQRGLHNRAVLAQLGKMTSLEALDLSATSLDVLPGSPKVRELSLRLEHGLGSLRGLNKLVRVDFVDANDFDEEEREWVALHFQGVKYTWARHAMH